MKKIQRASTVVRNNLVINIYEELKNSDKYKEVFYLLPKSFIYDKIREKTGLTHRTISQILNHRGKGE